MVNLLIIFLEIVIGLISAYLIYYVQKKGNNQADKEDLKKLTEIVEDVKKKNTNEIEIIKANLSLLNDRSKQIFNEEKDSIIVFFAQLNTWIWEALNININDYLKEKIDNIPNRRTMMLDGYNKTKIAFAKVTLIITDEDLINLGKEAIVKTFMIHQLRDQSLKQLYESGILKRGYEIELSKLDFENPNYEFIELNSEIKIIEKKQSNLIKEFNTMNINTAIEAVNTFKNSARLYIRK